MKRSAKEPKLVVDVVSYKGSEKIITAKVFDNRTKSYWTQEQIEERGITWFLNMADMKETLNWNLNGDESKYRFKWGHTNKEYSEGRACIYQ